jgi:RNA polymerase sigma factor FliA
VRRRGADIDTVWERYMVRREQRDRDRLIVHYAPLVRFVAGRLAAGLPQSVEQAELVSNGMFGLIDAIAKFDPGRGYKFETYAMSRIRGAILDELRSYDWVPRSVRSKARTIETANRRFEAEHHRAPSEAELAEAAGMTEEQLQTAIGQVSMAGLVALDDSVAGDGEMSSLGELLPDDGATPGEVIEDEDGRQLLASQINELPQRERVVLTLYYYEGLTLAEIGQVLGVTESRICQVHTKAVLHLKSRLAAAEREAPLDLGSH